jgi:hypothetical protein
METNSKSESQKVYTYTMGTPIKPRNDEIFSQTTDNENPSSRMKEYTSSSADYVPLMTSLTNIEE